MFEALRQRRTVPSYYGPLEKELASKICCAVEEPINSQVRCETSVVLLKLLLPGDWQTFLYSPCYQAWTCEHQHVRN